MKFDVSYFEDEVREGFFIPGLTKRSWAAQMDVLEVIDKLCEKHQLTWFAVWGTLLGAVRHQGFIPWDDDIDIAMKREDFERFLEIAKTELPSKFVIYHFSTETTRTNYVMRIVDGSTVSADVDFLKTHQGFPYVSGIDIFPLDYLAPNKKHRELHRLKLKYIQTALETISSDEPEQSEEEIIANIERLCGVPVMRDIPLRLALFRVDEQIFQEYNNVKSNYIAMMPYWYNDEAHKFSAHCFDHVVKLPFETMEINAPCGYEEVLSTEFGSWKDPVRGIGDYEYPFYAPQEREFASQNNGKAPYKYYVTPDDLKNDERQTMALNADPNRLRLQNLSDFHNFLHAALREENSDTALHILEKCQELAIQIGTNVEETQGEGHPTVKLLEEYCEQLYQVHEKIASEEAVLASQVYEDLTNFLHIIQESYRKDSRKKREILFFPFKEIYWNTMQPLYEAALQISDCEVYVIPIPYYERNIDGTIEQEHFDLSSYPKDLPLLDYRAFDYEHRHPEVMVIQNPYDEFGSATSVHPFFYAKNLKKYTEKLIYVPYFTLDEIDPNDKKSLINAPCYAVTPGVIHADQVILSSENIKQIYVNALTEAVGEETRQLWKDKLFAGFSTSNLDPGEEFDHTDTESGDN